MSRYHMNRHDKEIKNKKSLYEILRKGRFATVSMCRNNEPYITTMNYGYDRQQDALFFHCALNGLKLEFIMENPHVCGTVIEDNGYKMNECSHAYRSVIFWGIMECVKDKSEKMHGLKTLIRHLENSPRDMEKKFLDNDRIYDGVAILKLTINELTGKEGT